MHACAESLARLAPKTTSLADSARGHGELQSLDLAAALAGLSPGPYFLARVAWVDDRAAWQGLLREVRARLKVGADWEGVISMAAAEYAWPPSCRECFGRGEIKRKEYYGVCAACNGSGYGKIGSSVLADQCGVSGEEWKRVWASRYERVFRLVSSWGSEALSHLNRRLGN